MIAKGKKAHKLVTYLWLQICSKKFIQQGHSQFQARSLLPVREHRKVATCLCVAASAACAPKLASAASAKAGNAAGGFFQQTWIVFLVRSLWTRMGKVNVTHRQTGLHHEGKGR